jgi:hypothetical protein
LSKLVLKGLEDIGNSLGGCATTPIYLFLGYLVVQVLLNVSSTILPLLNPTGAILPVNNAKLRIENHSLVSTDSQADNMGGRYIGKRALGKDAERLSGFIGISGAGRACEEV